MLIVAFSPSLSFGAGNDPSQSAQVDALRQLDDFTIGAAIADSCDPSFDWNKASKIAASIGKNAYDELLRRANAVHPDSSDNGVKADQELQIRLQEKHGEGMRLVAEKTCRAPEIQDRMKTFEATIVR
jgi:hypothetical protein